MPRARGHLGRALRQAVASGKIKAAKLDELQVAIGLANKEGFPLAAKIDFVNNSVDSNTGTLRVRGQFKNADHILAPGMYVRVRVPIGEKEKAVLVGDQAVGSDQGKKFLYVVNDKWDRGIEKLNAYLAEACNPVPDAHIILASIYAQKKQYTQKQRQRPSSCSES